MQRYTNFYYLCTYMPEWYTFVQALARSVCSLSCNKMPQMPAFLLWLKYL